MEKNAKYQLSSGKIVTKEELREFWNRCNPDFKYNDVEFEMSLFCDIQNGSVRVIREVRE